MAELEEGKVVDEVADSEYEETIGEEEVVGKEADGGDEETIGKGEVEDTDVEETVSLVSIVVLELLEDPPNDAVDDEVAERDNENVEGVNDFPPGWLLFAASKIGTIPGKAEDVGTAAGVDT